MVNHSDTRTKQQARDNVSFETLANKCSMLDDAKLMANVANPICRSIKKANFRARLCLQDVGDTRDLVSVFGVPPAFFRLQK